MAKKKAPNRADDAIRSTYYRERRNYFGKHEDRYLDREKGFDIDTIRLNRRIDATAAIQREAKQRFFQISPNVPKDFNFEEEWAIACAHILCGYDLVETDSNACGTLGAAIWMLDRIKEIGKLGELLQLLPDSIEPSDVDMAEVWDPCHSREVLAGMMYVIQNRNQDCIGLGRPDRKFLDQYTAEKKHKQDVQSRRLFEEILDMIPAEDKERAVSAYMEKYWDMFDRYFKSRLVYTREETRIREECRQIQTTQASLLGGNELRLPDVRFVDRNMIPNEDLIRHADMIWIQPNALCHAYYYKIGDAVRKHKIPLRYFSYASATKCAEQVAEQEGKE